MIRRLFLPGIIVVAFIAFCIYAVAGKSNLVPEPVYSYSPLVIDTSSGHHAAFRVEIARTPIELEHGLMMRKSLPSDGGMLFIFPREQAVSMWMKDTLIPLDMIFLSPNGTITKIVPDTTPQSLDVISSDGPIKGVLEVNAGTAAKLAIHVGDKVRASQLEQ